MLTIEQCEIRNKSIMLNAISWAKGEECNPLDQIDIMMMGEYLNIKIPKCFHHFVRSENINKVMVTGAERTIFNTLDRLKDGLLKFDINNM